MMKTEKLEMYIAPAIEESLLEGEQVLCVSTGTNDWIVDPGQLIF